MDDELSALEAELQRLRPVAPSARLNARVDAQLAAAPASRFVRWCLWSLPTAAAIAMLVFLWPARRPPTSPTAPRAQPAATVGSAPADFLPVDARNVLIDASDETVLTLEDGTPARRYRQLYVDTITWKNPRTRASFTWTIPREEIRVQPISYQ